MGVLSELMGGGSATAAKYGQQAALQGLNLQQQQYNSLQRDAAPVQNVRDLALARIGLINNGQYTPMAEPDLAYRQKLANEQISQGAAARGKYDSGGRYMAQQDAMAGLASQSMGNQLSRLGNLAGFATGQDLTQNSLIGNNRSLQGNAYQSGSTQKAAGTIGQSNALSDLLSSGMSGYNYWMGR